MPAGTAVAKAEASIRAQARKKGLKGRRADRYVYGTLNKAGLMHGNEATAKGLTKALTKAQQTLAKRPRVTADY